MSHRSTKKIPLRATNAGDLRWQLDDIVAGLRAVRLDWRHDHGRRELGNRELPSREVLRRVAAGLRGALFPLRLGPSYLRGESEDFYVGHTIDTALNQLLAQVKLELRYLGRLAGHPDEPVSDKALEIVRGFAHCLPAIRRLLDSDVVAAFHGDPAARSVDEVLMSYPGVTAMIHHRLAHELYKAGLPLISRTIAEIAHSETGIDIHPGATIGESFFIDHGTGVVIGETAIIGDRVRLYQAVTLGAKRFPATPDGVLQKGLPRHPIIEDDVVVYAGATVLGRITIGAGATIGGNVWLTEDVPAGCNVTQASALSQTTDCGRA